MNDRELLELAAKAAGYSVRWHDNWKCFVHTEAHNITQPPTIAGNRHVWTPLDDDGDALRLAAQLRLDVTFYNGFQEVHAEASNGDGLNPAEEKYGASVAAATRRAIVRAAANIGQSH